MNLMQRRRALMAANTGQSGGIRYAEGDITLSSAGTLTIPHNLGTTKVAVHVWPVGTVRPTGGYQPWHMNMVNLPDAIPEETVLDFTGYNSAKFPEPITINGRTAAQINIANGNASPWTTQSGWNQGAFNTSRTNFTITENEIRHSQAWASGTYHWIVVDLSEVAGDSV